MQIQWWCSFYPVFDWNYPTSGNFFQKSEFIVEAEIKNLD